MEEQQQPQPQRRRRRAGGGPEAAAAAAVAACSGSARPRRRRPHPRSLPTAARAALSLPLLIALLLFTTAPLPASAQIRNALLPPLVNVGNVQIFGGADSYLWSVVKQASVPRVRVAAGTGEKASVLYTVRVLRQAKPEGFRVTGNIVINNPSNANTADTLGNGVADNRNVTLRMREVIVALTTFSGSGGETAVPAVCVSYTLEPKFSTTCTFVSNLLQPQAGQLTARVFLQNDDYLLQANFQRSYVQSLPVPFSFTDPTGGQLGCASVADSFSGRLPPSSFKGTPPNQKICDSQTFAYTAEFGPYKTTDCQTTTVANTAALNPDGGRGQTAQANVDVEIYGCDAAPIPAAPAAPPSAVPAPPAGGAGFPAPGGAQQQPGQMLPGGQYAGGALYPGPGGFPGGGVPPGGFPGGGGGFPGGGVPPGGFPAGFAQQQQPAPGATVQSAAISAAPLAAAGPPAYKWTITTEQSTGKVAVVSNGRNTQRVTYKVVFARTGPFAGQQASSAALYGAQGPRVEGTIVLTNPTGRAVQVAGVAADVLGGAGAGAGGVVATAPARCSSAVLPAATSPVAPGTLSCAYSVELPAGSESAWAGGRASVVARAALGAPQAGAAAAPVAMSAPLPFATTAAAYAAAAAAPASSAAGAASAAGRCARLTTSFAVTQGNRGLNMAIDDGGSKAPSDLEGGERFCGETKTYSWTLQVGPLGADEPCGGASPTVVQAVSRAFPLGGPGAKPAAVATDLAVAVQCPKGKRAKAPAVGADGAAPGSVIPDQER